MNQLVFIENNRPVTDSLTVAGTFEKYHKDVLRDIRELECSTEFRERNFAPSSYRSEQNKELPKYIITEQGFAFLVMGYTGKEAARFKEMYITEFARMRETLNDRRAALSPAEFLVVVANQLVEQERRVKAIESQVSEQAQTLTAIHDTFLQRDQDWRNSINHMLNGAARRLGGNYRELRQESYRLLEERGRCDLDKRLRNLHERLKEEGATRSKIDSVSRMDIIESDARLKEIYTTIVKEISIGSAC